MRVVLDSGPLSQLANPSPRPTAAAVQAWGREVLALGDELVIPEIADYEVRRELLRAGREASVVHLNLLIDAATYLPLTTPVVRGAADLWADARGRGRPTAADPALDGDVLLAAQARSLGGDVVVATTNPAHLSRYVDARVWSEI